MGVWTEVLAFELATDSYSCSFYQPSAKRTDKKLRLASDSVTELAALMFRVFPINELAPLV